MNVSKLIIIFRCKQIDNLAFFLLSVIIVAKAIYAMMIIANECERADGINWQEIERSQSY